MNPMRLRLANLGLLVAALGAIVSLLDAAAFWLGSSLLVAAALVGARAVLAREPVRPRWSKLRGWLDASLAGPAVAAFAAGALGHLAGAGWLMVPALAAGAALFAASVALEARLLRPADELRDRAAGFVLPFLVLVGFAAFAGVAGALPGGLPDATAPGPSAGLVPGIGGPALLGLVLADGLVGFLLGARLVATTRTDPPAVALGGGTYAILVGVAAALLRGAGLPRLVGPAVLAGIFYLWSAYRLASGAERRSRRWLGEFLALAAALALIVALGLFNRG